MHLECVDMIAGLVGNVLAVCVGRAETLHVQSTRAEGRAIRTAFAKRPVDGPLRVGVLGFDGDEHVYEKHGGPDMAVLAYSKDHYDHWRARGVVLPEAAAFGENLTVSGLTETEVHIGDVFRVGTAILQVAQPRTPCSKIAARYGVADLTRQVQATGFTGYLLRVIEPGEIEAGTDMQLIERESHGITVADASRVVADAARDPDAARRLLDVTSLAAAMRRTLLARIGSGERHGDQLGLDLEGRSDAG